MSRRFLAFTLLLAACTGEPSGPSRDAVVLTLVDGASQTALAGAAVEVPPTVMVTHRGEPLAGVKVTFAITAGGGTLHGATQVTNAHGIARPDAWVLGPAGPQAVEARLDEGEAAPVLFTAVSSNGTPLAFSVARTNTPQGVVALPVEQTPRVRVIDHLGRGVPDVAVSWTITAGNGGFRYAEARTGPDGTAAIGKWVLGSIAGENEITARVECPVACAPLTFRATGVPAAVHRVVLHVGDQQRVKAGEPVPVPPAVRLRDAFENLTPGRTVTFAVVGGSGSITGAQAIAGEDGVARVGSWVLGPGENLLRAEAEGVAVLFRAVGEP